MLEAKPNVIISAIGHDPAGRWAEHFLRVDPILSNYPNRLISFTETTNQATVSTATDCGWQVVVEKASINRARFRAVNRGLKEGGQFINLWDGDRLLYAAATAPHELEDLIHKIPHYDFLIVGATAEGIKTHPSSMTVWEGVKSWRLGRYLGIEGDIANRGCFGFSREFATFLSTYQLEDTDEIEGLFPILALAYQKILKEGDSLQQNRGIGYIEYPTLASFEDWMFEGLTPEESAGRKTSVNDFNLRGRHVMRILETAERIAATYGLASG